MGELLKFHEKFHAQLTNSCEIEELANCFVINSSEISDLYVDYCKVSPIFDYYICIESLYRSVFQGMEKSNQIIEEKSDGFFRRIQEENNSTLSQPIQSCLIWPVQKTMKYVQLLKEILDCITGESSTD